MDNRQRIFAAVILTIVISLSVGFVTEYVRQSMTFSWAIEEGDDFTFDVIVTGQTTNNTLRPLPFVDMNNTRISVEIISLPNVSIVFYSRLFLENIVEHTKTSSLFINGTEIPTEHRFTINRHVSRCVLPIGGWLHLDSFFPNKINRPFMEHESYLSVSRKTSFYFGYSENETYETQEWHGIIDLETGVPLMVSFWFLRTSQALTYWYNVTMNLVT
ncbi:MAG: hypothetical protein ACXAC0_01860 [Candidatus Thorarchaeota archaeon]|jgi:hypothetical protein